MPLGKKLLADLGVDTVKQTLYATPSKEKGVEMPKTNNYTKNGTHQADLLFLPDDDDFKYALVVVDLHTGLTDAEPLKDKEQATVTEAIKEIYKRSILDKPARLETDPGVEFKGLFTEYCQEEGISHRLGKTGRHRQQAVVEQRNGVIAEALNLRMAAFEQISGDTSRLWVSFLPKVIAAINNNLPKRPKTDQAEQIDKKSGKPKYPLEIGNQPPLSEGTKVRAVLEEPKDYVTGKRLHGNFRKGDQRWDSTPQTIKQVLMRPDQPVLYLLSQKADPTKVETVGYTRKQLQVVQDNEPEPDPEKLDAPEFETYNVHSVEDKRKYKNKIQYLVRWVGFPDPKDWTWQFRTELIKNPNVKKLIDQFEHSLKTNVAVPT